LNIHKINFLKSFIFKGKVWMWFR